MADAVVTGEELGPRLKQLGLECIRADESVRAHEATVLEGKVASQARSSLGAAALALVQAWNIYTGADRPSAGTNGKERLTDAQTAALTRFMDEGRRQLARVQPIQMNEVVGLAEQKVERLDDYHPNLVIEQINDYGTFRDNLKGLRERLGEASHDGGRRSAIYEEIRPRVNAVRDMLPRLDNAWKELERKTKYADGLRSLLEQSQDDIRVAKDEIGRLQALVRGGSRAGWMHTWAATFIGAIVGAVLGYFVSQWLSAAGSKPADAPALAPPAGQQKQ